MSRTERLLDLMQLLRLYRFPVSGQKLADELGISLRTLYRDIATLQGQGAEIDGAPGRGYVLRPGFMLPPMMFTEEEIEALVLGSRWVAARTDSALSLAGQHALAKIGNVLPADLRGQIDAMALFVPRATQGIVATTDQDRDLKHLREAIRTQCKVSLTYRDLKGQESMRTIWPIAIAFFEQVRVVSGWCELRQDYRNFRIDNIIHLSLLAEEYPRTREEMIPEWRMANGIDLILGKDLDGERPNRSA